MPVPFTWITLEQALLSALSQAPSPYNVIPPDFAELYPRATSYAESRICAEIPLLANHAQDSSLSSIANNRAIDISSISPIVVERVALITPATRTADSGTRQQYIQTTTDYIDMFWPSMFFTVAPDLAQNIGRYWAPRTKNSASATYTMSQIIIAPTPDASYTVEITGLFQPAALTSSNTQTYLSTVYPDLLFAGCMVFLEGALMRNYGAQADAPQASMSWEQQYQILKSACEFEEKRRRKMVPDTPMAAH